MFGLGCLEKVIPFPCKVPVPLLTTHLQSWSLYVVQSVFMSVYMEWMVSDSSLEVPVWDPFRTKILHRVPSHYTSRPIFREDDENVFLHGSLFSVLSFWLVTQVGDI